MNTQTLSQFELLDTELLSAVEGGKCTAQGAGKAMVSFGAGAAVTGFITGGPLVAAVSWHGGVVGGAIVYGATCWW